MTDLKPASATPMTDAELDELDASITDSMLRKRELEDEITEKVRRYRHEVARRRRNGEPAAVHLFRPRPSVPMRPNGDPGQEGTTDSSSL